METKKQTKSIDVYKRQAGNINAALPYMDEDMRELAKRTLSKVEALSEEEYAGLAALAADEV